MQLNKKKIYRLAKGLCSFEVLGMENMMKKWQVVKRKETLRELGNTQCMSLL
jgi:hypothetical protein